MYPVVHKIKMKDKKKLANRKKKNEKTMLLDSNPHLLSAKTQDHPLGYREL